MDLLRERIFNFKAKSKQNGLWRHFKSPCGIDFSSNDYLGLSGDSQIKDAIIVAVNKYGYGSTSSRFIRGYADFISSLEDELATYKNSESALIFNSGYTANLGVMQSLITKDDIVFSDKQNHASIIDGLKLVKPKIAIYDHVCLFSLEEKLKEFSKEKAAKFLITESLFSMSGKIAPLNVYSDLCKKYGVYLIIDEAHAVGLYGKQGCGLIDHFSLSNTDYLLSVNPCGKAFGVYGAFLAGDSSVIDYVMQRARSLMYTTAMPFLSYEAIRASLNTVKYSNERRDKLFANVKLFLNKTGENLLSPIAPIVVGDAKKAIDIANTLQDLAFDVRAFRPPTVEDGKSCLRVVIHSFNDKKDIMNLKDHLDKFL